MHRLEQGFDSGAVLAREDFPLTADECHESLDLKIQMAMRRLAGVVAVGFDTPWRNAAPQTGGSYWPRWTDAERTLDFSQPVQSILRQVRAFGLLETLAPVNGSLLHVRRAAGWPQPHANRPGSVVHAGQRGIVVAARDGYIALTEWSLVNALDFMALGRRAAQPSDAAARLQSMQADR